MGEAKFIVAAVLLSLFGSAAGAADQTPICPDRPGKATSACTVPLDHWQVESGLVDWTLQRIGDERDTTLTLFQTTIKYGVTGSSDLELAITPWERQASRVGGVTNSAQGIGDADVIYKQRLTSTDGPVQIIAMPFVKLPIAKHPIGNGEFEGGILFPIGYAIAKTPFSIGLTPQFDWVANADNHGHHSAMEQVVTLGWAVNPKLNVSAELWGGWDWDPSGTTRQASADGSIAYLVNNDLQLDGGADFGLNRVTPDIELYVGISKRF